VLESLRKPLRFVWRTFCWYLLFTVAAYVLVIMSSVAAVLQNCSPIFILNLVLNWSANWPAAVAVAVVQIGFGLYFGYRSMDDFFWRREAWPAQVAIFVLLVVAILAILRNDADFPVWTAYKIGMYACSQRP
jgi:hypothetical protein